MVWHLHIVYNLIHAPYSSLLLKHDEHCTRIFDSDIIKPESGSMGIEEDLTEGGLERHESEELWWKNRPASVCLLCSWATRMRRDEVFRFGILRASGFPQHDMKLLGQKGVCVYALALFKTDMIQFVLRSREGCLGAY